METPLVIIPAAGFGTRMATTADPSFSKELLMDPMNGNPIICWGINAALQVGYRVLVISRKEKKNMRAFLHGYYDESVEHLVLEAPTQEWPYTILSSKHLWATKNLLLLPDVRFSPKATIQFILNSLQEQQSLSLALHDVPPTEVDKFGMVSVTESFITEKPQYWKSNEHQAWGLLGFTKDIGVPLFSALGLRDQYKFPKHTALHNLKWFKDITRKGVVEQYET